MKIDFVETPEAISANGLRMTVVSGVPSPWGEAAKLLFHVKNIPWRAVRLDPSDDQQVEWTGEKSAPVAIYDNESPRGDWDQILLLAERLAPDPSMLPADPSEKTAMLAIAKEIMSKGGLLWFRRLQLVDAGLKDEGGFSKPVAEYLARKYGHSEQSGVEADKTVIHYLNKLSAMLREQRDAGSRHFRTDGLSCLDIYSAAAMALFKPLPQDVCAMRESTRAAFETLNPATAAALDPLLIEHRDAVYEETAALPLSL